MTKGEAIEELKLFKESVIPWDVPILLTAIDMAIEALQTDIVWCKDCKYKDKVGDVSVCRIHEVSTRTDDYCSRGERSEE